MNTPGSAGVLADNGARADVDVGVPGIGTRAKPGFLHFIAAPVVARGLAVSVSEPQHKDTQLAKTHHFATKPTNARPALLLVEVLREVDAGEVSSSSPNRIGSLKAVLQDG